MLKHIHLENFKSWRELDIDLAPLTLLFGTNSSGKSSVLQSLLLLTQTHEKGSWQAIHFGSKPEDNANLGSYTDVVFNHDHDRKIVIGLKWNYKDFHLQYSGKVTIWFENDEVEFKYDQDIDEYLLNMQAGINIPEYISYLGPLRQYPQRSYLWSGAKPILINKDGENTIAALISSERSNDTVHIEVGKWLVSMGLVDKFSVPPLDNNKRFYEPQVKIGRTSSALLDVGFGISQVLPVITTLFFVPEGSIVLLEQPELHLHPRAQAHLADLFLHVAEERHLQLIVESHSEHLLRRIQRRVAEAETSFATPENLRMYFCQKGENGSTIEQVKVDTFGQISNWPENFFGDITGDLEAMTFAALQRSRNGH